jgi:hypothetical protein
MVSPAGVPVAIMIYEESGSGVLITCYGSGRADRPPTTTGERVETALIGAFDLDVKNGDQSATSQIEELVREAFGEPNLQPTLQAINLHATTLGLPLAQS